jgi:hypothetical protein
MTDKFRYHILPDKIYLIQVKDEIREVLGKDLLQAYLLQEIFGKPLRDDSVAD